MHQSLTQSQDQRFWLDLIFDITLYPPAYLNKVLCTLFLSLSRIKFLIFLHCQSFIVHLKCLMNELIKIDSCILTLEEKYFTKLLLYGDGRYDSKTNTSTILASINFVYSSKRFDAKLMWWKKRNICLSCLEFAVAHVAWLCPYLLTVCWVLFKNVIRHGAWTSPKV